MRSHDQLRTRDDYDRYMDELAGRISGEMYGEKLSNVIFACCAVVGFAMSELDREERAMIHPMVTKFMAQILEGCNEQDRLHS
jgi:hypothetical protein